MRNEKRFGQSIVEFALVIPLFLLMVVFILDFGRVVFIYSSMTHAVREGARLGSVSCSVSEVNAKVIEMATFSITPVTDCITKDDDGLYVISVSADYYFEAATPFIQNMFPDNEIIISVESTMHREFTGE